eukprot:553080-Amphidinium_carterae.3
MKFSRASRAGATAMFGRMTGEASPFSLASTNGIMPEDNEKETLLNLSKTSEHWKAAAWKKKKKADTRLSESSPSAIVVATLPASVQTPPTTRCQSTRMTRVGERTGRTALGASDDRPLAPAMTNVSPLEWLCVKHQLKTSGINNRSTVADTG